MEGIFNAGDIARISKYLNDEAFSFKHRSTVELYRKKILLENLFQLVMHPAKKYVPIMLSVDSKNPSKD